MEYTVKEYAQVERVDVRTVKRWVAKGAVDYRRTPGGRIRIIDESRSSRVVIVSVTHGDNSGQTAT